MQGPGGGAGWIQREGGAQEPGPGEGGRHVPERRARGGHRGAGVQVGVVCKHKLETASWVIKLRDICTAKPVAEAPHQ